MPSTRHVLSDVQYECVTDLLPGKASYSDVTAIDNRLFINAVLYVLKIGIQWRDTPERFGT